MNRAKVWAWVALGMGALLGVGCTNEPTPAPRVDAGLAPTNAPHDAGAAKTTQGNAGAPDAGAEPMDVAPYQPVEVVPGEVRVSSEPPGAQVFEGPTPKCKTPCVIQFESASTQRKLLRLSLEGHRDVRVFAEPGASRSIDVKLTPLSPSPDAGAKLDAGMKLDADAKPDVGTKPDAGAAPDAGVKPH